MTLREYFQRLGKTNKRQSVKSITSGQPPINVNTHAEDRVNKDDKAWALQAVGKLGIRNTSVATAPMGAPKTQETQTSASLSGLPYEIRQQIYGHLLSDHRIIIASRTGPWRPIVEPHLMTKLWPAILATNHQIHDEAASVLYGSNTFLMSTLLFTLSHEPLYHAIGDPDCAFNPVRGVGPSYTFGAGNRYCKYIKKIVTYTAHGSMIDRKAICAVLGHQGIGFKNVTMLAISFKGPVEYYEECASKQWLLLERVEWDRLKRYIQLDGHAEWLEDGRWLVYWGQRQ